MLRFAAAGVLPHEEAGHHAQNFLRVHHRAQLNVNFADVLLVVGVERMHDDFIQINGTACKINGDARRFAGSDRSFFRTHFVAEQGDFERNLTCRNAAKLKAPGIFTDSAEVAVLNKNNGVTQRFLGCCVVNHAF